MLAAAGIAEIAYEAQRAYNDVIRNPWIDPPWSATEVWYREAYIRGVQGVLAGLTPRELHERWYACFAGRGWERGDIKDPAATPPTHPNLVSWDVLPPEQRFKDLLFREHVLMLARVGTLPGS